MIAHSQNFKEAITRAGRDIKVKIYYYTKSLKLKTEDNKLLLTEDNKNLLTEPIKHTEPTGYIDESEIISLRKNNLGEICHTYMKSFDLATTYNFEIGEKLKIQIGTTVNNSVEYLDYGTYIVYEKEYDEVNKYYKYVLCDSMLLTMVPYDNDTIFGINPSLTLVDLLTAIHTHLFGTVYQGLITTDLSNRNVIVDKETFDGVQLTCRDVLDMIVQAGGCSLIVQDVEILGTVQQQFVCKSISNTVVDEIDEDIVRDDVAIFKEKFGPINSLILSRADGTDEIEVKDDESIAINGKTSYVIKDNLILQQEHRDFFIDDIFNKLNGLEYYTNDINTIGVEYIEYLDKFNVRTKNGIYPCLCLQNTSAIDNGIEEKFTSPQPKEYEEKYVTTVGYDDKVASILMDKINGTIVLKTFIDEEDGKTKLSQVRLDSSGEEGSLVEISGDQIILNGATTINEHFYIDEDGYMYADNGGKIANWNISDDALYKDITIDGNDYRVYIQSPLYIDTENTWIFSTQKKASGESGYTGTFYVTLGGDILCKDLYYQNLIPTSIEEKKKNFEKLQSGLDIIKDIDVYKYNYTNEKNDTKKHIGMIIGDKFRYSKEITSDNNSGVDIYSFVSVCCKAIQEQQKEIEQLKKEIKELKK